MNRLDLVASMLMDKETIDAAEFETIMKNTPAQPKPKAAVEKTNDVPEQ